MARPMTTKLLHAGLEALRIGCVIAQHARAERSISHESLRTTNGAKMRRSRQQCGRHDILVSASNFECASRPQNCAPQPANHMSKQRWRLQKAALKLAIVEAKTHIPRDCMMNTNHNDDLRPHMRLMDSFAMKAE